MSGVGQLVMNGPLILAVPVAAVAGAITFAPPCCLPLIPGYLSYVAGRSGAGTEDPAAGVPSTTAEGGEARRGLAVAATTITRASTTATAAPAGGRTAGGRGRMVAGTALFVLGFSALFASHGAAVGGQGGVLPGHQGVLSPGVGRLTTPLGPPFAGQLLP